jgi:glycosyltransferase involved in cell wall biosynthesis
MTTEQVPDPVRVAFVLHVMQVAGAEVLVADTIRRLGPRITPVVLCLDGVGQLGERMREAGVPVIVLGRRPGFDLGLTRRFAREINAHDIEVVHAHQYTPFFYAALSRPFTRRRVHLMFTEHGRHYPDVVSWKRRLTNRVILGRLADEIHGVCQFSADSLARTDGFTARPITVIRNGIDLSRYPATPQEDARRRLGLPLDRRFVTAVARFHPVKDHAMLLRAFATVAGVMPDVELLLAGDGPLRDTLSAQATELGIASRVRFLGVRDDVPIVLRASDVYALTSISEAASLTLLEAMACRLPVVVTNVGGNPEIVEHGKHGFLVPRGDDTATARAILELLQNPARAQGMGEAGYSEVSARYRLEDTIDAYYDRYVAAAAALRSGGTAAPSPAHTA